MASIRYPRFFIALGVAALLAGGGCGSDDGPGSPGPATAGMTRDEFEGAADAMVKSCGDVRAMFAPPSGGPGCLSVTVSGDSDGDGFPDQATFTFSETGCRFEAGNVWGTVSGTIRLTDGGSGINCGVVLTNLAATLGQVSPARTVTRILNGTRTITGTTGAATLTQDVTMNYAVTGGFAATVVHRWGVTFTASAGSPPILGAGGAPVGDATVQGEFEWNCGERTRLFVFTTATPLRWEAGCDSPFPSAGEIHAAITIGTVTGYVKIVYQGCGSDPVVDFIQS